MSLKYAIGGTLAKDKVAAAVNEYEELHREGNEEARKTAYMKMVNLV
jgi:hypothetical protein